ncbi:hypothetical protein PP940_gp050 [Rhizobium phage RL2RES]|uniref:Uncharacterized protein n=1 Tax=Rhizobium phage RL2RES TaxID=103371 RepID=A0A6B9J659_9CAUD|nr:hypothetical protein PP940_gp050 [Rhizobium phage RL2RES]QGZ14255.1 hypothetical protein RL2RES_050 [Rhizobium phage RL2RES]
MKLQTEAFKYSNGDVILVRPETLAVFRLREGKLVFSTCVTVDDHQDFIEYLYFTEYVVMKPDEVEKTDFRISTASFFVFKDLLERFGFEMEIKINLNFKAWE